MRLFIIGIVLLTYIWTTSSKEETDFYKLLGVGKDATSKEIRKAFKALAVKLHPDKNKDDKDAESKFIKIVRAYEVLKDPDARNRYDMTGDTGDNKKQNYHSYSYYRNQFGIYDDDPLIITLGKSDYEMNILDKNQAWFVNFYSPNCHHCHDLAPTWRKLAVELEGVVRIAAVNCEDDWMLCRHIYVESYPSLLYYEKEATLYDSEKYVGDRTLEALKKFVLNKVPAVPEVTESNWDGNKQWLLFLCTEDNVNCPEKETQIKLKAIMDGLMSTGIVKDEKLCDKIYESHKMNPVVFWQVKDDGTSEVHSIEGSDSKEILDKILNILPNPETIDEERFKEIRSNLRLEQEKPWLLCFYLGPATELNLQLKRLPTSVPNINIGLVHCGKSAALCSSLHIARYPTWGVLKVGGAFEPHHGRDILHEVATFARDSVLSTNFHALSPADYKRLLKEGGAWFVDWYAPWCPPCKRLMPEVRRASQKFDATQIQFGSVDCTMHKELCQEQGIRSYPTTMVVNGTNTYHYHGAMSEADIRSFIEDLLDHTVVTLDSSSFAQLMRKPEDEIWIVDFYAPWCNPCQKLAPEWRKLAKYMSQFPEVKVAQVDCVENSDLCSAQNVHAYPTIRLYPLGSKGLNTMAIYNGNRESVSLKRWLLSFLPSPVLQLNADQFREKILADKSHLKPWLVDFYAPWCGHCVHFDPEYRTAALKLEDVVHLAKIDCEKERYFCGQQYVTGYPTVYLYYSSTDRVRVESRTADQLVDEVKKLIERHDNRRRHDEL